MPPNLKTFLSKYIQKNIFPKTILSQHAFHSISFLFHTSHENIFGFIGKNQLSGTLPTPYDSGARAAFFVEVSYFLYDLTRVSAWDFFPEIAGNRLFFACKNSYFTQHIKKTRVKN